MGRRLALGPGLQRGSQLTFTLDGGSVTAYEGETVAAVLLAEGFIATRTTPAGEPRGVFCGMGVCFDCLVIIDGVPNTRACMTQVQEGMEVRRQHGLA
jgi:D-hydroxyproline dehydrogenase subunit gamma